MTTRGVDIGCFSAIPSVRAA
eukprot:COSAG01_NODE_32661_length_577_cov_3.847280_1_plen_20_part_10